ncbi:AAA family ATPase [Loktanella sp. IMCC34160]|uniref:AAA family ATPase n=1 Tax=Loktanella sp. IMCC34160 TaxID=2510646 RepID=UPI001F5DDCFA|nr:AAA family ATPase [Loktanella sp. IMCC34160]
MRQKRALDEENCISARGHSGSPRLASSRFGFDVAGIEAELRAHIIGQDHVIDELIRYLRTISADIGDPRRPLASVMFTGPTGVGKTETVRLLARALYGDADAVCRVDMNTLAQEHYAAALTGAPPGYVGSKEGTTILNQEKIEGSRNLPGIVLFDELEKASDEVVLALLNVFDNGMLTVASGERTISFRNSIVFMTSNLGTKELDRLRNRRRFLQGIPPKSNRARVHDIMINVLLRRFPPEFINRIDHIETFNWISAQQIPDILAVEVERLNARLRKHSCQIKLDRTAIDFLAKKSYDERFGARGIRRTVRKHLDFPLADYLLDSVGQEAETIGDIRLLARLEGTRIIFERMHERQHR